MLAFMRHPWVYLLVLLCALIIFPKPGDNIRNLNSKHKNTHELNISIFEDFVKKLNVHARLGWILNQRIDHFSVGLDTFDWGPRTSGHNKTYAGISIVEPTTILIPPIWEHEIPLKTYLKFYHDANNVTKETVENSWVQRRVLGLRVGIPSITLYLFENGQIYPTKWDESYEYSKENKQMRRVHMTIKFSATCKIMFKPSCRHDYCIAVPANSVVRVNMYSFLTTFISDKIKIEIVNSSEDPHSTFPIGSMDMKLMYTFLPVKIMFSELRRIVKDSVSEAFDIVLKKTQRIKGLLYDIESEAYIYE